MATESEGRRILNAVQSDLVTRHLGLVWLHLRRRVRLRRRATRGREAEDLFQEGCLGLMQAALQYDGAHDGRFEPFALLRIRAAVHKAIHERFATVRVPVAELERRKTLRRRAAAADCGHLLSDSSKERLIPAALPLEDRLGHRSMRVGGAHPGSWRDAAKEETVGQHLLTKHRLALSVAVERVAVRCRRHEARRTLEAVAAERLAIPCDRERTSLRLIAGRFKVSVGRVAAWQRDLEREARNLLRADGEFAVLKRVSMESDEGNSHTTEARLSAELAGARVRDFRRAFAMLDRSGRGLALLMLLHRVGRTPAREAGRHFARLPCDIQREVLAAVNSRLARAKRVEPGERETA